MATFIDDPRSVLDFSVFVVPVNCRGTLGAGLARTVRDAMPWVRKPYEHACTKGLLRPGTLFVIRNADSIVICLPTKDDWRMPSTLALVEAGLNALRTWLDTEHAITKIAIPRLGCGLGGLNWTDVHKLIVDTLAKWPGTVYLSSYSG